MSEWSDAEISRRLALAIGWPEVYYHQYHDGYYVRDGSSIYFKRFDYRDPAVIWPIAERFNAFPAMYDDQWSAGGGWFSTAAKAVALAVIKSKEQT